MHDFIEPQPRIARRLGEMERAAWIFDRASPFNMGAAIDLHGEVDARDLKQVLRWCQTRRPLLRSIIRQRGNDLYFACYEPDAAPEIALEISTGGPEDRDRIATEELRKPFDAFRELMIRIRLVCFAADHCALFITFQHLIVDGFSAAALIVDIVDLLSALARDGALPAAESQPFPPALEEGAPARFKGWRGFFAMVRCQARLNGHMRRLGGMPAPLRVHADTPFAERLPTVETFSLDAAETAGLIETARKEQVTLYALLTGVLLDSVHPFLAESEKSKDASGRVVVMPIPTNMRPFLSVETGADFGFFASTFDVAFRLTGEDPIAELAKAVRAEIKSGMTGDSPRLYVMPTLAAIMNWRLFFPTNETGVARAARFIAGMAQYSCSSLTFLNLQKLSAGGGGLSVSNARGYVAPSMLATALFSAVLSQDSLNIHMIYNERQFSAADAAQLKRNFRERVLALAARS